MARADSWYLDVRHNGLGTYRRISGGDKDVVEARAQAQLAQWDKRWDREQNARASRRARDASLGAKAAARQHKEDMKVEAEERTAELEAERAALLGILQHTLGVDDRINFDLLKSHQPFADRPPAPLKQTAYPPQPVFVASARIQHAPVTFFAGLWEGMSAATREKRLASEAAAQAAADEADRVAYIRTALLVRPSVFADLTAIFAHFATASS